MVNLAVLAFLIGANVVAQHEAPNRINSTKRSIADFETITPTYSASQFKSCGLKQEGWNPFREVRLITAWVVETDSGFAPCLQQAEGAMCEVLAVDKDNKVKGRVAPSNGDNPALEFTIVPGSMIGKEKGTYFMFPSDKMEEPPIWFPVPCEYQKATPRLAMRLATGGLEPTVELKAKTGVAVDNLGESPK
jgi:hypothetical protein